MWKYSTLGDATTVEKILASGIPVDTKTSYGATALIFELGDFLKERGGKPAVNEGSAGSTKKPAETLNFE